MKKLIILLLLSISCFSQAIKVSTTHISMNNSGTEASPRSILQVVTDINDATWISVTNNVVTLNKPLDWSTGFLLIPDNITVVLTSLGTLQNGANSATTPTNGLELRGSAKLMYVGSFACCGNQVQRGTGTFKCTGMNGIYPTVVQQAPARVDTVVSVLETLTASNYVNVITKIDGLNMQLNCETHLKWYTANANSYQNNINIQRGTSGYIGGTPTAFQLFYGTTLADARSSEFAVAGDGGVFTTVKNALIRPYFDINTSRALSGYFYVGTNIDIIDPQFATGGGWNGLVTPTVGAAASGSQLRWKTTYNTNVAKGNTKIGNVKVALLPTKVGPNVTEIPANTYVTTSTVTGSIVEQTLMYKEWFMSVGTANQGSSATTTWNIFARHPLYNMTWSLKTATGSTSLLIDNVSASDNTACTLTEAQVIATTAPYTGVTFNRATKTITVTENRTDQELYNSIQWWLYQNTQMDLADFSTFISSNLNVTDWNISGLQFITGKIQSTGTITAGGAFANVTVTGNVSQPTPTNIINVVITGTLTYATATPTTVTFNTSTINTLINSGIGIVTISNNNSNVTTYTDAEINYLDSYITLTGTSAGTKVVMKNFANASTLQTVILATSNKMEFKRSTYASVSQVYLELQNASNIALITKASVPVTLAVGNLGTVDFTAPLDANSVKDILSATVAKEVWGATGRTLSDGMSATQMNTNFNTINTGVQKASLAIPYTGTLPQN